MEAWQRFDTIYTEALEYAGRKSEPTPITDSGISYVVGLRMAIMGDYRYKPGRTFGGWDGIPENLPASASGKREECLVCVSDIKTFKPYLVRKKDVRS